MDHKEISNLLTRHHIKPTANRILVAKALSEEENPMSMKDLENEIITIDKSGIFRTLTLFREHHMVHVVDDGDGNVRYELCNSTDDDSTDDDQHVHFFCEHCHKLFCLDGVPVPEVPLPEGFSALSLNYVVKGLCPHCREKLK